MPTAPPPTKPPPAPPKTPPPPQQATTPPTRSCKVTSGKVANKPEIVVAYGPGGIGKSTLAQLAKTIGRKPLVIDIGRSTESMDVDRVGGVATWEELLAVVNSPTMFKGYDMIVIDDLTTAQEFAEAWTIANVPKIVRGDKQKVDSLKDYGWGEGDAHLYETFSRLLAALDQHYRAGRSILCLAHDHTPNAVNPTGEDFKRYEPRLSNSRQGNICARVREWCDHLLFVGYDLYVKDGKGKGNGTRTIYPCEMPTHMAKSRTLAEPLAYIKDDPQIWNLIYGKDC